MDALLEQAVQGMKKNGFEVVEVRTAAEACDYLLAHIDAEKSVGVGGSVSVRDTGVLPALAQKGCKVYTSWGAKPEDVPMIRENSRRADVYLSSANAVTRTGKLVLVDGTGNRVGAICDGPEEVYFVISHSKVVDGGINTETGPLCIAAGVDWLVAGSSLFHAMDPAAVVNVLHSK